MNTSSSPRRWRRPLVTLLALLGLIGAACGATGSKEEVEADESPAGPIFLQGVGGPEEDPFTDSVTLSEVTGFSGAAKSAIDEMIDRFGEPSDSGGRTIPGDAPGLYGGSGDDAVCDLGTLGDHLIQAEDPTKAKAFASAVGIDVEDLADFLADLTPLVLTTDTLVLNHGFTDGEANPFPAVLQAGTAVAVDRHGVPRVKCGCGNPLAEVDRDLTIDDDTPTTGDPWEGWNPTDVTTPQPADEPIDDFDVIDPETGETHRVPAGGSGDDCYVDPDGHGPDCDDEPADDPDGDDPGDPDADDCYVDPDGHGPDCPDDQGSSAGDSGAGVVPDDSACTVGDGPFCGTPLEGLGLDEAQFDGNSGWDLRAEHLGPMGSFGTDCPAGGDPIRVYGGEGGVYADHSSICSAAVHDGRITAAEGGIVYGHRWSVDVGQPLRGRDRNGVEAETVPDPYPTAVFKFVP